MNIKDISRIATGSQALSLQEGKIPISLKFNVAKNTRTAEAALEFFRDEQRALVESLAERDGEGNIRTDEDGNIVFGENKKTYDDEVRELMDQDIEIEFIDIKMSSLDENTPMAFIEACISIIKE